MPVQYKIYSRVWPKQKTQLPSVNFCSNKVNNRNKFLMKNNYSRINQRHLYSNLLIMRNGRIISVACNTGNVNLDTTHSRSPTRRFLTLIFKSLIKLRTVVFIEKLNIHIFAAQNNYEFT